MLSGRFGLKQGEESAAGPDAHMDAHKVPAGSWSPEGAKQTLPLISASTATRANALKNHHGAFTSSGNLENSRLLLQRDRGAPSNALKRPQTPLDLADVDF